MNTDELRDALLLSPKNGYIRLSEEDRQEMERYCLGYRAFLDECKTEREATAWAVSWSSATNRPDKASRDSSQAWPGDRASWKKRGRATSMAGFMR